MHADNSMFSYLSKGIGRVIILGFSIIIRQKITQAWFSLSVLLIMLFGCLLILSVINPARLFFELQRLAGFIREE
jgi:Ca2+/Na+ antiporter